MVYLKISVLWPRKVASLQTLPVLKPFCPVLCPFYGLMILFSKHLVTASLFWNTWVAVAIWLTTFQCQIEIVKFTRQYYSDMRQQLQKRYNLTHSISTVTETSATEMSQDVTDSCDTLEDNTDTLTESDISSHSQSSSKRKYKSRRRSYKTNSSDEPDSSLDSGSVSSSSWATWSTNTIASVTSLPRDSDG